MPESTIDNLKSALDCVDKCDCCKELEEEIKKLKKTLNRLESNVNHVKNDVKIIIIKSQGYEHRIVNNEKGILRLERILNRVRNNNLEIEIQKIKQSLTDIEVYINILDDAGKQINNILRSFIGAFSIFK